VEANRSEEKKKETKKGTVKRPLVVFGVERQQNLSKESILKSQVHRSFEAHRKKYGGDHSGEKKTQQRARGKKRGDIILENPKGDVLG